MSSDKRDTNIRKHAIGKRASSSDAQHQPAQDTIELPTGKILIGLGIIAVIALVAIFVVLKPAIPSASAQPGLAAVVNGERITWDEIDAQYQRLPAQLKGTVTEDMLLNQSVNEKLLLQGITKENIQADPADLASLIARVKSQFGDDEFNKTLEAQGLTYEQFQAQLADRLKMNALLTKHIPGLAINETEIEQFFQENKATLSTPEQVKASHILVNSSDEAAKILAMLKNGSDFATLAKQYSLDGSATSGGDLGYFSKGMMVKAFEDAAFSLPVGGLSGIVQTQYGYHIVKVTDKRPAKAANLAELRALIRFNIFDTKLRQHQVEFQAYMDSLRKNAQIEIYPKK